MQSKSVSQARTQEESTDDPALNKEERPKGTAFQKIVELVNSQERSAQQLRTRLQRLSFPDDDIENALVRAQECGLVNDMRYADVLIRSRISQGYGSIGIENELKRERIDISDVPGWPFEFPVSYDEELARALAFLNRKPTRAKNLRDGAFRKLVQKGYPTALASKAAQLWIDQQSSTQ